MHGLAILTQSWDQKAKEKKLIKRLNGILRSVSVVLCSLIFACTLDSEGNPMRWQDDQTEVSRS